MLITDVVYYSTMKMGGGQYVPSKRQRVSTGLNNFTSQIIALFEDKIFYVMFWNVSAQSDVDGRSVRGRAFGWGILHCLAKQL